MTDACFEDLLVTLDRNREGVDDVALFTAMVHSPLKLPELERRNEILCRRYAQLRKYGFSVGVNVLCTVGHHEENVECAPSGCTPFTDIFGNTEAGTCCPNDPEFRSGFLKPMYRMLAEAGPDFIWLDDDIRWCWHGKLMFVCFCDHCMAQFNRLYGTDFTRETLHRAFNSGPLPERLSMRKRHLASSGRSIRELFRCIASSVYAVDPRIELGVMDSGMRWGDNADFDELCQALMKSGEKVPRWRPGGGAYNDSRPDDFLDKAAALGAEAASLPDSVVRIQSEIECFNYQRLRKSAHAVAMEAAIYHAAGLTGAAWNIMDVEADPLCAYEPLISTLCRFRPFFDRQVVSNQCSRPIGVYNGWTQGYIAGRNLAAGDWCGREEVNPWNNPHASELFAAGIPPAYRMEEAQVTMLNQYIAWTLPQEVLIRILHGGLYCDVDTLAILEERGLGRYTGFQAGRKISRNARERLKKHPLCTDFSGFIRDCRQSFPWGHEDAWELLPADDKGESLAELVDYQGTILAECSLGIYENEWGGRVAVAGYYPLRDQLFLSRLTLMKRLFSWLSHDQLIGWISSYHRIALWARQSEERLSFSLLNASQDKADHAKLMAKTNHACGFIWGMDGLNCNMEGNRGKDGYVEFTLPQLAPWTVYQIEI